MRKTNFYKILFLVCFWEFCAIFIVFYDASVLGFMSAIEGGHYSFYRTLMIDIINCFIGASLLGSLEVLYLSKLLRKKPFGKSLLIKTAFYIMFMLFFISIGQLYLSSSEINQPIFSKQVLDLYVEFLTNTRGVMTISYWSVSCILALFILQVSDKFGQRVLINFLTGKYHRPKGEERIFMFMDLKSSTTYAEKLGHIKYSELIQDCFFDLTDVVLKHHARVYQYVGDEVVLSWVPDLGIKNNNCINTYIEYDRLLKKKSDYYKNKFGINPEFKAGVDIGYATIAEVGEIKKELAYHGDVVNTASRIQGKCNDFNAKLLISEKLWEKLESHDKVNFELIGNILLKGKERPVNIYKYNI